MAKPAQFDRQDVVEKAMNLYWEKGFHATSMRNLQEVIDMRPGSIYAAFGSKEGLFSEALDNYVQRGVSKLHEYRVNFDSPMSALRAFVKSQVIGSITQAPSGICMLAKTVSELTDEHSDLLEQARQALKTMEQEFAKVIVEAQEQGEVSKEKEVMSLASYIQVQIAGLRIYAKVAGETAPLEMMIDNIFEQMLLPRS
ncbi:TetR family transcriptional regulator [Vibrio astriarenae]|uniref:TetR family transcriptional regulator n=1 Tax=Vibrio astriarenae TaxID=1481923 RepID=A0A7Z2T5T5_9VIBR|nr:TetR/AcrR family transcriptional regulator [Vibrio astriarenae]QIA64688.1 TetR family transcriptional regulator [Vibrio astriarenae]